MQNIFQINNTPFTIVRKDTKKHIICVGNNQISEKEFNTVANAKKYIEQKPWELLINMCFLAVKTFNTIEKGKENGNN